MMWALVAGGVIATIIGGIGALFAFCASDYNTGTSPQWAPFAFILSVLCAVAGIVAILFPIGQAITSWIL